MTPSHDARTGCTGRAFSCRTESFGVRLVRKALKAWPVQRGRGRIIELLAHLRRGKPIRFTIDDSLCMETDLADTQVLWAFVGDHERDEAFQLSLRFLRPGDVTIDVGANVGLWALPAAARIGLKGSVHAFEPLPANMRRLRDHITLNQMSESVRCVEAAAVEADGPVVIHGPPVWARGYYNSGGTGLTQQPGSVDALTVDGLTLDSYCAAANLTRVDFLKVDVEGAELRVFRGAERLLRDAAGPAIMFEMDSSMTAESGWTAATVKSFLATCGYDIFGTALGHLTRVPLDLEHEHSDLFALKPHHLARFAACASLRVDAGHPRVREHLRRSALRAGDR